MPSLKLIYFDFPGRAESARLLLNYGGVPFEDFRFKREEWPAFKAQMPFGQVPVLEVDGKQLAQSAAIDAYAAKLAGLCPSDPWEAAKVDEIVAFRQELQDLINPTGRIKDTEERIKARQELMAGPLGAKLAKLSELLGDKAYFVGDKPTYADFNVFNSLSLMASGFVDGITAAFLDSYPALKAHHNRIASLPAVAKMYDGITEGLRVAYKPLP